MSSDSPSFRTDTPSALPPGTRLGEFELLSLLGVGGFGIVYLAFDHALEREVAVKEYMPASLAGRTETMHVSLRSHSDAESFALGLRSFVNEAKLLARFDHPSLLKVHRFWEANGTAYMAMPVLRGRTLKEIRADMTGPPDESWMRNILLPLLGAIEKLHSEDVYHRDIAPDNIQIEPDGRPVLLDFGAARRVLSDKSQALTAILKPAYAPIEQYGEAGSVRQGPWTDIYALGATLHYMLLGRPPSPATARTVHDEASHLTTDQVPGCTEAFLQAIDWMLCPRPLDRPQSVAELRQVLEGEAKVPVRRSPDGQPLHWERTNVLPPPAGSGRIDLDVDDGSTQIVPKARAAATSGTTEHVWLEPHAPGPKGGAQPASKPVEAGVGQALAEIAIEGETLDRAARHPAAKPASKSKLPWLVGGSLAAVAVAVFFMWPKGEGIVVNPTPAATAPSALPTPAQASMPASSVVAPAPASQVPPVAAAPESAAPASAANSDTNTSTSTSGTAPAFGGTAVAAPSVQGAKPEESVADKPGRSNARPVAAKPAENPRPRADPPAPKPIPAPAAAVPAGPGPACGSRDGVRYLVCMERECGTSEFSGHPACQRWKQ